MFFIRHISDLSTARNRESLARVQVLFRQTFPDVADYADTLPTQLARIAKRKYRIVLLVLEDARARLKGFALAHHHADLGFLYLDYLVGSTRGRRTGAGGALYEALRDTALGLGATAIFMDVPPDDPDKVSDHARLKANRARLRFYERYEARPIINTGYDGPPPLGQDYDPPYLVVERLKGEISRSYCRKVVAAILGRKYGWKRTDPYTKAIVASFTDDPVRLREPLYTRRPAKSEATGILHMVLAEHHEVHHVRERGYVERPARVTAIQEGLKRMATKVHVAKRRSLRAIMAVHDRDFVTYLDTMCGKLGPDETLYPYVFPYRRPDRKPKEHWLRAGYYCIDTFTPLSRTALAAARGAVDCSLTGADLVLSGERLVYSLCRPPGHHAESKVFGGFCYFNNAALAANALSKRGKVAFLDIDYHHGNGSQDIFYGRDDVFFVSLHGHPRFSYPYFSGFADEKGEGRGLRFNLNIPLPEQTDDIKYLKALDRGLRAIRKFAPDFLVVSLGFDIMQGDPTGGFSLTPETMRSVGASLGGMKLPTLFVQEGGYALRNLRRGAPALFSGFMAKAAEG